MRVPTWRLLAVIVAATPVIACASPFGEMEDALGSAWRRAELVFLCGNVLVCFSVLIVATAEFLGNEAALFFARGYAGWLGLALVSWRLFGARKAWIGPLATLPLITFWGYDRDHFRPWEFSAAPLDRWAPWGVAFGLLAAGVLSRLATPWRMTPVRARLCRLHD